MKKIGLFIILCVLALVKIDAQTTPSVSNVKKYKIVFQLTNGDTAVQRAMVRQIYNALTAAPNSKIEVVCHSAGISFLQSAKTLQADKIKELKAKGVTFAACENTLRERKIEKSEIVSEAFFVPAGIIEVVDKQTKGWSYLKAGF